MKKILFSLFILLFSSHLFAAPIKEIIFFGDSLSDDGNLYRVLKILPKSPPYYKGRFSNGPTWAEHVGMYYYKKSYLDYTNYCYGGASAIIHNPVDDPFIAPIILQGELDSYFLRSIFKDKSQALYVIWIGANDYLYEGTSRVDKLTTRVVDKITWSIQTLIDKGGKSFLIFNLPDMSKAPYARNHGTVARLEMLTRLHNGKLNKSVKELKTKYPTLNIIYFDVNALFTDMINDPDKYNQKYGTHVTNTTQSCWPGTILGVTPTLDKEKLTIELQNVLSGTDTLLEKSVNSQMMTNTILNSPALAEAYSVGQAYNRGLEPCKNADEFVFWDDLHPTAVVHQVLGQIIVEDVLGSLE